MPNIEHSSLTGSEQHEPKGIDTAVSKKVYVSDGAGSGEWKYMHGGWGHYVDAQTEQTFNTTAVKLEIDGAGLTSESSYLPAAIRGTGELWDTTNFKITPIQAGDAYTLRLDLPITARTSANYITVQLDIGGGATPSIVIVEKRLECDRSAPFGLSVSIPLFALSTFVTNGCQVFLTTDTGSIGITAPSIHIQQTFDGTY